MITGVHKLVWETKQWNGQSVYSRVSIKSITGEVKIQQTGQDQK